MQRRLVETESNLVRESLQKFLKTDVCSACHGSRLKRESRHIFIDDLNISDLTNCSTSETLSIIQKFDFKAKKLRLPINPQRNQGKAKLPYRCRTKLFNIGTQR